MVMLEITRGDRSRRRVDQARRRGPTDPMVKTIVMDMLITTAGFLLMVAAVLLVAQGLSPN
jgi:hypothetical protein